jgi:MFS family permease
LRQRPKYFSMVLGAWAIGKRLSLSSTWLLTQREGTILGPVLSGTFVQYLNWRWVFYLNAPFCLAGFIVIPLFIKLNKSTNTKIVTRSSA